MAFLTWIFNYYAGIKFSSTDNRVIAPPTAEILAFSVQEGTCNSKRCNEIVIFLTPFVITCLCIVGYTYSRSPGGIYIVGIPHLIIEGFVCWRSGLIGWEVRHANKSIYLH
jgi:hypothetical protein